jgi:hypothetical protein
MPKQSSAKQRYILEYMKCKNSFHYFAENYILLELPGGDEPFKMYELQKTLIDIIEDKKHVIVLKSRQVGISTTTQAYCCWLMIFFKNVVVGIVSKDGPEATTFARTIAGMIDKLPNWMKPKGGQTNQKGFSKRSEQSFILTNGSKCFAATVNPKAPGKTLRGKAITFLVIDEAAFVDKVEEAWTSMVPALSTNQKHARKANVPYGTILLSTPNKTTGQGAFYYKQYMNAISGNSLLTPFVIHWRDIDELVNDPEWYKQQCLLFDNNPRKIKQELELVFLPSEGAFFDDEICQLIQENTRVSKYTEKKIFNGVVYEFENFKKGHPYLISVDTASEHGNDFSAINVFDYITMNQVWEYKGKSPVKDFCKVVLYAATLFSNGPIIIENNSYGTQVVEFMEETEFSIRLYRTKTGESKFKNGLTTSSKTRPLMIDALYSMVSEDPLIIKSKRLALELVGLVQKPSGKVEADNDCNDDLAMTLAFAAYVRKYDTPLMLDVDTEANEEFANIIGMNDDITGIHNPADITERNLKDMNNMFISAIKENLNEEQNQAYINVFDFFQT